MKNMGIDQATNRHLRVFFSRKLMVLWPTKMLWWSHGHRGQCPIASYWGLWMLEIPNGNSHGVKSSKCQEMLMSGVGDFSEGFFWLPSDVNNVSVACDVAAVAEKMGDVLWFSIIQVLGISPGLQKKPCLQEQFWWSSPIPIKPLSLGAKKRHPLMTWLVYQLARGIVYFCIRVY